MFKYVEHMRKDALAIMSRTYGARHKTTGEAFYDEYPLQNLVKVLCYEDEEEASAACRHYGIAVEGDKIYWRRSKFREPKDPEKGSVIPLKPRKMIRTIESKLRLPAQQAGGAPVTRMSICRGGVSGEGAAVSSLGSNSAEVVRKKAQKAAEETRKEEARKSHLAAEARAQAQAQAQKMKAEQEKMAANIKARAEAEKRAQLEKLENERIQRELIAAEQRRKEEEAQRILDAKAAAERAERARQEEEVRKREAAQKRAEEEARERARQRELARQREEEARRRAEIKAAKERAEKEQRELEEQRRLADLRKKAEEERVRRAREEEVRRIEMKWQEKIEKARKVLAWRLWRKQMSGRESLEKSRRSLENLDPTSTYYPKPVSEEASIAASKGAPGRSIFARDGTDLDVLERKMYQLATASRQPIDLSKVVADLLKSSTTDNLCPSPTVQSNQNFALFKLAVLLPKRTPAVEHLHDTLRVWVDSHLQIGHVSSHTFKKSSHIVQSRAVAVIGNEDTAQCKNCNAALLLLPFTAASHSHIEFPEEVNELLNSNTSCMVLVLDDERGGDNICVRENLFDRLLSKIGVTSTHRQGVVTSKICDIDGDFGRCCKDIVMSHFESMPDGTQVRSHMSPSLVRVSLVNLGFLCLQRLMQNMDAEGCFRTSTSNENFFRLCEETLNLMIHELQYATNEIHQKMQNWPPNEFWEDGASFISMYFDGEYCLPFNWHRPLTDLRQKVFGIFNQLGEESFATFVEMFVQELLPSMSQNLLTMLDNGDIFACFANVVSLFVNGDINVETEEEALIYLPTARLLQIIEQSALYEAPRMPEPVFMKIPSHLHQIRTHLEEKENSPSERNTNEASRNGNAVQKRKSSQNAAESVKPSIEKVKRIRSNTLKETEEMSKSKEFTSLLEALL